MLARGGTLLPARAAVYAQPIAYGTLPPLRVPVPPKAAAGASLPCAGAAAAAGAPPEAVEFDVTALSDYTFPGGEYLAADLATGLLPPQDGGCGTPVWRPLAPPQRAFTFDLAAIARGGPGAAAAALAGAEAALDFTADAAGACNAVAAWFELDLLGDGSITLTTSPHAIAALGAPPRVPGRAPGRHDGGLDERGGGGGTGKGGGRGQGGLHECAPSFRQAVHPLGAPRPVARGERLRLVARHDSYAVSFAWRHDGEGAPQGAGDSSAATSGGSPGLAGSGNTAPLPAGVPGDAAWAELVSRVSGVQRELARIAAQQPARHRVVVAAALRLAAAPRSGGADAQHAAELAASMFM